MKNKEVNYSQEVKFTNRFLLYFAASLVGISLTYVFCITFLKIPIGNERYADVCLGFLLGTLVGTIITFYYGSSKDNRMQNEYNELVKKLKSINDISSLVDSNLQSTTNLVESTTTVRNNNSNSSEGEEGS